MLRAFWGLGHALTFVAFGIGLVPRDRWYAATAERSPSTPLLTVIGPARTCSPAASIRAGGDGNERPITAHTVPTAELPLPPPVQPVPLDPPAAAEIDCDELVSAWSR